MRSPVMGSATRTARHRRKQTPLTGVLISVLAMIAVVSAAVRVESGPATAAQPGDSAMYRFEVTAQSGGASRVVLGHPEDPDLVFLGHGPRVLVVDVSNLAEPRVVGRSDPLPAIVEDLAYDSGILYAAFDSGGDADSTGGIAAINVVNPLVPHVHSVFETDVSVRRIALLDRLVVAAGNVGGHSGWLPGPAQAFLVVDRSDLSSLRETARVLYPEDGIVMGYKQPAGIAVANGFAFMLRNTVEPERTHVHALDLADPAEPVELGHVAVEGSFCGVLPKSSELLIVAGIWHGGDEALLHSVNIRDSRAMRLSRTIRLDSLSCIRGMRMDSPDGSRVLVMNRCTAQMHAIDASRPGYPEVEATHQLTHPAADVAVGDHGWFVAADDLAGLWTYKTRATELPHIMLLTT